MRRKNHRRSLEYWPGSGRSLPSGNAHTIPVPSLALCRYARRAKPLLKLRELNNWRIWAGAIGLRNQPLGPSVFSSEPLLPRVFGALQPLRPKSVRRLARSWRSPFCDRGSSCHCPWRCAFLINKLFSIIMGSLGLNVTLWRGVRRDGCHMGATCAPGEAWGRGKR